MYSITDFGFWLSLIEIVAAIIVAFYIPGRTALGKTDSIKGNAIHVVSFVLGIALWAWQGYAFGMLHMRWLSYVYLLLFIGLFIKGRYVNFRKFSFRPFFQTDWVLLVLALVGIFAQTFQYYDYGLKTVKGIITTVNNPNDHIWHAALIRELITRFPPNEPGLSGVPLKDYHYWFNLVTADLIRVFHLSLFQTQFIGMYVLASVLLAFVGYFIGKEIYDNKLFLRLLFFFLFFAGDASIWVAFFFSYHLHLHLGSIFNNGILLDDRPPFAYSLIIGLVGLYLIFLHRNHLSKRMILIISLIFGSLIEFKVYTGIILIFSIFCIAVYDCYKGKMQTVLIFLLSSIFGAIIFFPNISHSAGLIFLPFELPRSFLTQSVFHLRDWQLRWEIYSSHRNYLRIYEYGILMSLIYLLSQFGIELLGFIPFKKMRNNIDKRILIAFFAITISGTLAGLLFYQTVGGANSWEFFLPTCISLGFLVSLNLTFLFEHINKYIKYVIILIIVVIVLPRWIISAYADMTNEYLSGFHGITNAKYSSYEYLKHTCNQGQSVLVVNGSFTSYASMIKVITGCDFYFSGVGVRQQVTPEIARRQAIVHAVKRGNLISEIPSLKRDHVKYIFFAGKNVPIKQTSRYFQVVFHNSSSTIIALQ